MKRKVIAALLYIMAVYSVPAQETWTLQRCLEAGLKNNLDFKLQQLEVLSAQATSRSALVEFLPTIGFTGNHSYSIGSTIDPATNNRVSSTIQSDNFAINTTMDIVNFNNFTLARRNRIAVLKAKADKEAAESEYSLSVLENYFNVLYTQELLDIQIDQFENAKFNLARIEKEASLGSKAKSDLYDMQVVYAQEENAITETRQLLYNQKLTLLQLLNVTGVSPDSIMLAPASLSETAAKPADEVFKNALVAFPKVRAAELQEAVARKEVTMRRNGYLPVINAFYAYSSFYYRPLDQPGQVNINPFWTQLNDNKNHYVGLQVTLPIFNGFRNRRNVKLAKLEQQKSAVKAEQEKIALRQAIEQDTAKQQQSEVLAGKLEETRTYAQKSFETTQSKFTNGLVEAVVFTTSKNQLLMAEYNLLKARFTSQYLSLRLFFFETNRFPY